MSSALAASGVGGRSHTAASTCPGWRPSLRPRHAAQNTGRRRCRAAAAAATDSEGGPASSAVLPPAQGGDGRDAGSSSGAESTPIPRLQGRFSYKMVKAQPVRLVSAWTLGLVFPAACCMHAWPATVQFLRAIRRRAALQLHGMHLCPTAQHAYPRHPRRWRCCRTSCAAAACPSGAARTRWHQVSGLGSLVPVAAIPGQPRCMPGEPCCTLCMLPPCAIQVLPPLPPTPAHCCPTPSQGCTPH